MMILEASPVAAVEVGATSPWPLVATCAVLVALFLVTESVRLVRRGERLVVRRGTSARLAGPGLVLVAPLVDETGTISVTTVDRRVVAPGPVTPEGARVVLVVRVAYRVEDPITHGSDETAWRAVQLATRRAVQRIGLPDASSAVGSRAVTARLHERVADELVDLGIVVEDLRVERTFLAPELRLTSTAAA